MFTEVLRTLGNIFLYLIGILILALVVYAIIRYWQKIKGFLAFVFGWIREYFFSAKANNRRAAYFIIFVLLIFGYGIYQLNRVVKPYMPSKPATETVYRTIDGRNQTEKSHYQYWDGNQEEVTQVAKPKSLRSFWWFVRWAIVVFVLGLCAIIYFFISRIDELKEAIKRAKRRFDKTTGGVLKADEPGFFERLIHWHRADSAAPVAVAAPLVAVAGAPGVTVAAPEVGTPGTIAQTVAKVIPEKFGFLKKYSPWLAFGALFIDEILEILPKRRRR